MISFTENILDRVEKTLPFKADSSICKIGDYEYAGSKLSGKYAEIGSRSLGLIAVIIASLCLIPVIILVVTDVYLKAAKWIIELHYGYSIEGRVHKVSQRVLNAGINNIDNHFGKHKNLGSILRKFFSDKKHPMDLHTHIANPKKISIIANTLINLEEIGKHSDCEHLEKDIKYFNSLMQKEVNKGKKDQKGNTKNLLNLTTKPFDMPKIRAANDSYYKTTKEQKEALSFDVGIRLNDEKDIPSSSEQDRVSFKVPGANGKIVSITKAAFKKVKEFQEKQSKDLQVILKDLQKFSLNCEITARTKSPESIMDKAGRMIHQKRTNPPGSENYIYANNFNSVEDLIDVNGCRLLCDSVEQIPHIIEKLESNGYELYRLDNKYGMIQRDGAYKVMALVVKHPKSGCVFEIQITTLASTIVNDLFHNFVYKLNDIQQDLAISDDEVLLVKKLQRMSAILETMRLSPESFELESEDLDISREITGKTVLKLVKGMHSILSQFNLERIALAKINAFRLAKKANFKTQLEKIRSKKNVSLNLHSNTNLIKT